MSVRSLGQLTIDMLLKMGAFETDMGRAARVAEKNAKQIQRSMQNAAIGVAKELATVAGLSYSIAQAWQGFQGAIDAADKVDELNARLGISTEKLSEYRYAARLTGSDIDSLAGSLGKFSKNLAEAQDPNSKQAKLFKTLGIQVQDATGRLRQAQDVLPEVMDRFKALTNDTLESATAMELFGKSGAELLEFLNLGSGGLQKMGDRARELGGIIDGDTAAAAAKFRDRTDDMTLAMEGLYLQVAAHLLPQMTQLTETFTDYVTDGERVAEVSNDIANLFQIMGAALDFVVPIFKAIDDVIQGTAMGMVGLAEAAKGVINLDWDQVKRGWEVANQGSDLAYYGEEIASQMRPGVYSSTSTPKPDGRPVNQPRRSGSSRRGGAAMNMTAGPQQSDYERALQKYYADEEARAEKARKAASDRAKEAAKEAKQRTEALERNSNLARQAAADLEGPYASAVEKARQQDEAWRKELDAGNMTQANYAALVEQQTAQLAARRVEMEKQQAAPQALLDTMTGEMQLLGMVGPARERYQRQLQNENDMRRAIADAIEAGNTALRDSPDMQAKLIAEARAYADWSMQVEEAAAMAEQWAGIVIGGIGDASTAFADFVANGADDFGDFWDDLKNIAKRGIADLIRQLLQQKIVIPIQTQIQNGMNGQAGEGIWNTLAGLFNGNGFSGAGQGAGNWASLLGSGNGGAFSSLAGLFGGSTTASAGSLWAAQASSGAGSLANFGNNVSSLWGAGASGGASAGAGAGASSMASAVPIIGWIIAGMMKNAELFDQGWDIANGESWAGKAATLGAVSHADKVFRSLGFSDKISSILSGSSIHAKLFGRKKPQITGQGITGSYGFEGFSGSSYADVYQKGGLFRSSKRWTQYGSLDSDVDKYIDQAIQSVRTGTEQLATQLGTDISKQLEGVRVNIGKVQLDADPTKAQQQIEALIAKMVGELSTQSIRILGFGELLDKGFESGDVISALAASISLVTGSAEGLGRALLGWELGNITKGVEFFMELAQKNGTNLEEEVSRVSGVLSNYGALMTDVQAQLMTAGLSDYQRAALGIETTYREQVRAANDYAKALGLSGARAEDLAKIEELRAVNMAVLQRQIEQERESILGGLALSDLSPLSDQEKLAEGMKQLQEAVAAGDLSSASALSQSVLGLGRNLFASGKDYDALYDQVTGMIGSIGLPSLEMDDGTTMGDLAGILTDLPQNFARALFAFASGAQAPLPSGGTAGIPTGGNGQVNGGTGSNGNAQSDTGLLTQIRDLLSDIAGASGKVNVDRAMERLEAMNR